MTVIICAGFSCGSMKMSACSQSEGSEAKKLVTSALPCVKQFNPLKVYGGSVWSGGSLGVGRGSDMVRVIAQSISNMVVFCPKVG